MLVTRRASFLNVTFALVLGACFSETGGTSASGTDGCPDGSAGCACYGNGTCDPMLECREGSCVPPGCVPGEEGCVCNGGLCLSGLECSDNVCKPPTGGTASDSGPGTSTSTATSDATSSDSATDTGVVSISDSATMGTGGNSCGLRTATPCSDCAANTCCAVVELCIQDANCACWFDCQFQNLLPAEECSLQCGPTPVKPDFDACATDCGAVCPPPQVCDVGHANEACSSCVRVGCCTQYNACLADPECSCLLDCRNQQIPYDQCLQDCGLMDGTMPPAYDDLSSCALNWGCVDDGGTGCY